MHRSARKTDTVYAVYAACGIQQIGLPRARRGTPHVARSHGAVMRQNNRYTRAGAGIFGIADADAVNVGNQISWTRSYHKVTKSKIMILVN